MTADFDPKQLSPGTAVVLAKSGYAWVYEARNAGQSPRGQLAGGDKDSDHTALRKVEPSEVSQLGQARALLFCHAGLSKRRLGLSALKGLDVLELFAFVRPAQGCAPSPQGLAQALDLPVPDNLPEQAQVLFDAANLLLRELDASLPLKQSAILGLAQVMSDADWAWSPMVNAILRDKGLGGQGSVQRNLAIWRDMPEWEDGGPQDPPGSLPLKPDEVRTRLADMIKAGSQAEIRPQQAAYAQAVAEAFAPAQAFGEPQTVLAEAGTGTGKTLGYLAPASVWADKNKGSVWLSTFTRVLQGQLDQELDRLYPEPAQKQRQVVVRKGRENYLCLMNYEEASQSLALRQRDLVFLALMARWMQASRSGELVGGDLPVWMGELFSSATLAELADHRGECLFSACNHYRRCYVERSIRKARQAKLVIANHALVLHQAATQAVNWRNGQAQSSEAGLPTRYVFDEGHHLFDAADSVFCAHLTGRETQEMRRWLLGREDGRARPGRRRGLQSRLDDLLLESDEIDRATQQAIFAATCLPAPFWAKRLAAQEPQGAVEAFLLAVGRQVYARTANPQDPYTLECDLRPVLPELAETATALQEALGKLEKPLVTLERLLADLLANQPEQFDSDQRRRLEGLIRSLTLRAIEPLRSWRAMMGDLLSDEAPEGQVDWLEVVRIDGQDRDLGAYRHFIDPTRPLMHTLRFQSHGLLITSATLGDTSGDPEADWRLAERRTGAAFLPQPALLTRHPSPFNYGEAARIIVITDVNKQDSAQVAGAMRGLMQASSGGALGLFTSIARMRQVHGLIAEDLEQEGLTLLAQHIDASDPGSLIEMFRSDTHACLIGTDALRDGIDVPGLALRMVIMDRVPWPRPTIIHKARRAAFGGRLYDEQLVRFKLRQAFGRLIRRHDDRGVFVMLDAALPTRLTSAFPEGLEIERLGLQEALAEIRGFF